jgi:DNA-binding HxlR family transcriptional regulator
MVEKVPAWCAGEDWCPMTAASNILGGKWRPVILSKLIEDSSGFNELRQRVNGISSKVLSENLDRLEEDGLVEREVVGQKPFRVKYSVTEAGKNLEPVLDELDKWAEQNLKPGDE